MSCRLCGNDTKDNRRLCPKCWSKVRRHRHKIAAISLLGGKCMDCGYDDIRSLEFHHEYPSKKEFNIGSVVNKKWTIIKEEILKCKLLCSNCHRQYHRDREDIDFLNEVFDYTKTFKNEEVYEAVKQYASRASGVIASG